MVTGIHWSCTIVNRTQWTSECRTCTLFISVSLPAYVSRCIKRRVAVFAQHAHSTATEGPRDALCLLSWFRLVRNCHPVHAKVTVGKPGGKTIYSRCRTRWNSHRCSERWHTIRVTGVTVTGTWLVMKQLRIELTLQRAQCNVRRTKYCRQVCSVFHILGRYSSKLRWPVEVRVRCVRKAPYAWERDWRWPYMDARGTQGSARYHGASSCRSSTQASPSRRSPAVELEAAKHCKNRHDVMWFVRRRPDQLLHSISDVSGEKVK